MGSNQLGSLFPGSTGTGCWQADLLLLNAKNAGLQAYTPTFDGCIGPLAVFVGNALRLSDKYVVLSRKQMKKHCWSEV